MNRYSRQPHAIAAVRTFLVEAASGSMDPLPTYGDVARTYGGIARGVAPVLNSVARGCALADEPDLSALVVDASTGLAGSFGGVPVEKGATSEARWRAELDRIRQYPWNK